MSNEELAALCAEWQKILRLQDWDVEISFKRNFEMGHDCAGECSYSSSKKAAQISILTPADYSPKFIVPIDTERTVVHELLHLHTALFVPVSPTADDIMHEEQLINLLSGAFVALKRTASR